MRTAIYIRVSTDEQVQEGYSISAQKNRLQAYCIAQDWEVVGFYIDEGISAKDMNRPELQRMNEHIKMGLVDCVLVYKLDRLTRSVLDLYKLLELFDQNECKFKSATEVYDTTTAMGRLFITIVAALAQWERENIGERVRVGLEEKVRQGKYAANTKPFGYALENSELTIIPDEAKIIKRIYSQYLDGFSTLKIANSLIENNIPGLLWSDVTINRILKNPVYKGTIGWGKNSNNYFEVDDVVPPIISKELFDEVQLQIESRNNKHPRQATSEYIFSGVAKCGLCGEDLVGSASTVRGKKYKSYRCKGRIRYKCNLYISDIALEKLFLVYLNELKYEKPSNEVEINIEQPTDDREELEQELNVITKRRKKWQFAWVNESITDEEFSERMKEETEKEKYINDKLSKITTPKNHTNDEIKELLRNIEQNWNVLTAFEKKTSVNIIVKSFVVDREPGTKTKYEFKIKDILIN